MLGGCWLGLGGRGRERSGVSLRERWGELRVRVEGEERAREAWRVAEEEKRARGRARVQMHARARRREVVEID